MDESPPQVKIYQMDGRTVSEKEKDAFSSKDSKSVSVEHNPAKKQHKFNRQIWTFKDLSKTNTVDEYNESKEDAAYVRRIKEREAMRIRINTKNRDSE